jgi:hypothetical protein
VRKHAFDPASFVLGLVLSGVALIYLVAEAQNRSVEGAWVLPLTLIGLGLAAVVAGLNRAFRREPAEASDDTDDSHDSDDSDTAHLASPSGEGLSGGAAPSAHVPPDESEV